MAATMPSEGSAGLDILDQLPSNTVMIYCKVLLTHAHGNTTYHAHTLITYLHCTLWMTQSVD